MDSQDKNESKIRQREETLARRVGEVLDQMNPRDAGQCPDAEIIAAYTEQALGAAESAQWEGHFAACARCRKILRVLAASADAPLAEKEVTQLGELVSTARAPIELAGRSAGRARPKLIDWRPRWLAPALGVAAVLVVWFVMRPPWRGAMDRGAAETLVAQAPKEEVPLSPAPAEVDQLSKDARQQDQKSEAAPPPKRSSETTPSLNSPVEPSAKRRAEASNAVGALASNAQDSETRPENEKKENTRLDDRATGASPTPSSPPPVAGPPPATAMQAQVTGNANAPPKAPYSTSPSVTATGAAPEFDASAAAKALPRDEQKSVAPQAKDDKAASRSARELPLSGGNSRELLKLKTTEGSAVQLRAPSGAAFWRAGKGGIVERSTDAGKSWVAQASPFQEDWLAGVAVSDTVSWLVGRNGALARTMDGEHWERVALPVQGAGTAGKLPDWTGITARDAQSVTITASDGRHFATQDGGKSWLAQ